MFAQDFMMQRICIKGEVSNCKYHSSGHLYFTIKDKMGQLACVMFASAVRNLAFRLQEGNVFFVKNRMFYLFSPRENEQIVISEKDYPLWLSYLLFLSYSFLFYIIVSLSCYSIWRKMHNVKSSSSIFNHLFRSLIIFFVVGITIVFVFISLSVSIT